MASLFIWKDLGAKKSFLILTGVILTEKS